MKTLQLLIITLCILISNIQILNAYSIVKVDQNKIKYSAIFEKKIGPKIHKISKVKREQIVQKINLLIEKYEQGDFSDTKKEEIIGKLLAIKEIINKSLENIEKTIVIRVIDDKRCTNCQTEHFIEQIKLTPGLENAIIIQKDFSDNGVKTFMEEQGLSKIPSFIFSSNNVEATMKIYLDQLPGGEYSLNVGAQFDPFIERSERGFLKIDTQTLKTIKQNSYIQGNNNAEISWIEYSDIECPFCARLHNAGTIESVQNKYGDKLNFSFHHFPLEFHANAKPAAEIVECLGSQKGSDVFYSLINKSFSEQNSDKDFLIDEAVKLGANKQSLQKCLDNSTFSDKIDLQMSNGSKIFGITGTPGNVIINNITGEYVVISGAYPLETFVETIDSLLK